MASEYYLAHNFKAIFDLVRPSTQILFSVLDALVTSGLYLRYQTFGSTGTNVIVACGWNLASIALSFAMEAYNRRSFLAAQGYGRAHARSSTFSDNARKSKLE
ncbi:MAG: hypothetical protein WDW36_009798 [Sanguina aurantia]